jgi:PAS domain S-box-containing protein
MTDLEGIVTYWSHGSERLFGWSAEEMVGRDFRIRLPEGAWRRVGEMGPNVRRRGELSGVRRDIHRDGTRILTDFRTTVVRDVGGREVGIIDVCRDTTRERIVARMLEEIPEAVAFVDLDHRVTFVNRAFEEMFGYSGAEIAGQPIALIAPDAGKRPPGPPPEILRRSREEGRWSGEVVRRRRDGTHFPAHITVGAVYDDAGLLLGHVGITRDITADKEQEAHLRRAERLASIGTLVGGVAHELNNPLAAIRSFAQLMLLDPRSPDDRQALDTMHREAERAAAIVADLGRSVRTASECRRHPRTDADLNEIVRHVLRSREYALRTHDVRVRVELDPDLPAVVADRAGIEQVVMNLLVNAEQALLQAPGTGEIRITTRESGGTVVLVMEDSGPGVAHAHLDRIFEPFFTTKGPGEGVGLGLALVHGIVAEHGGHISADNVSGGGARFTVRFPMTPGLRQPPEPAALPAESRPLRVLVVDDEASLRNVVSRYLGRRGHTVRVAADGAEALRVLDHWAADVVLTDLRMPGGSGEYLLDALRRRGLAHTVVFMTGDAARPEAARMLESTGAPVILKPFDLSELGDAVEQRARGG